MTQRKRWVWGPLVGAGLAVGALGGVFVAIGLERADQLAGVVGAFVGLAGLVVSAYGVVLARRTPPATAVTGGQQVAESAVGGDITQLQGITGGVRITRTRPAPGPPPAPGKPPAQRPGPPPSGGQSVTGSQIGGSIDQAHSVDGDVDIESS